MLKSILLVAAAPQDRLFALINDLYRFKELNPLPICLDMNKTVGKDFEAGLGSLKALAEKP